MIELHVNDLIDKQIVPVFVNVKFITKIYKTHSNNTVVELSTGDIMTVKNSVNDIINSIKFNS